MLIKHPNLQYWCTWHCISHLHLHELGVVVLEVGVIDLAHGVNVLWPHLFGRLAAVRHQELIKVPNHRGWGGEGERGLRGKMDWSWEVGTESFNTLPLLLQIQQVCRIQYHHTIALMDSYTHSQCRISRVCGRCILSVEFRWWGPWNSTLALIQEVYNHTS